VAIAHGFELDPVRGPGSATWPVGGSGHLAYVTAVDAAGDRFTTLDRNNPGLGVVTGHIYVTSSRSAGIDFIG
jgi:hypothetical protein